MRINWLHNVTIFALLVAASLMVSCGGGGGGGGGIVIPPPNGGGGGSTYPQHYTTDLDGVWLGTISNLRFSYFDPDGLLSASQRADFEADLRDSLDGPDSSPTEIANGREVVGTIPTMGFDSLHVTENRVSKLSASQYEKVFRLAGTVSSNGQTANVEIVGIGSGFVNAGRTVWTGTGDMTLDMSSAGQTVRVSITYDFMSTKTPGAA